MRKKTASRALEASMLRIQEGSSPSAEMAQPRAITMTNTTSASRRVRLRHELRKYFNLHLLRTDIVGDVLGGDGQLVRAGDRLLRNDQLAGIGGGLRIPPEFDGRRTFQPRDQRARALRGLDSSGQSPGRAGKRLRSSFTSTTGGLLAITNVFDSRYVCPKRSRRMRRTV